MATFYVQYTLRGDESPTPATRIKRFVGDFADYAAANTAEGLLRTDLQAATDAAIVRVQLTEDTVLSNTPTSGAALYEVASVTVPITTIKNANIKLPAPVSALQSPGNTIDTSEAAWEDLMDNFTSAAGWEVSDGEHIDTALGYGTGKLIYERSGASFNT